MPDLLFTKIFRIFLVVMLCRRIVNGTWYHRNARSIAMTDSPFVQRWQNELIPVVSLNRKCDLMKGFISWLLPHRICDVQFLHHFIHNRLHRRIAGNTQKTIIIRSVRIVNAIGTLSVRWIRSFRRRHNIFESFPWFANRIGFIDRWLYPSFDRKMKKRFKEDQLWICHWHCLTYDLRLVTTYGWFNFGWFFGIQMPIAFAGFAYTQQWCRRNIYRHLMARRCFLWSWRGVILCEKWLKND